MRFSKTAVSAGAMTLLLAGGSLIATTAPLPPAWCATTRAIAGILTADTATAARWAPGITTTTGISIKPGMTSATIANPMKVAVITKAVSGSAFDHPA